jgi:U5 small nuclear ribonucleoprotein component
LLPPWWCCWRRRGQQPAALARRGLTRAHARSSVCLAETVKEVSYVRCFAKTPNGRNKLTMIASPLEPKLVDDLERGAVPTTDAPRLNEALQKKYGYDLLASRSVWAFGPSAMQGPNALIDDSFVEDKPKVRDCGRSGG